MIKIYGFSFTRSTRATWALEEAGAEYEFIPVNLSKQDQLKPEFLKMNPGGKIPILVDGDLVLTESAAICTYIGERYASSGLVPSNSCERANYFQWSYFAISELEAPLWTIFKHTRLLPEELRVPAVKEACVWEFHRTVAVLAEHMEGREFVVGTQFTGADILLGGILNWAQKAAGPLQFPVLEDYAERMSARPALLRAREREAKAAV